MLFFIVSFDVRINYVNGFLLHWYYIRFNTGQLIFYLEWTNTRGSKLHLSIKYPFSTISQLYSIVRPTKLYRICAFREIDFDTCFHISIIKNAIFFNFVTPHENKNRTIARVRRFNTFVNQRFRGKTRTNSDVIHLLASRWLKHNLPHVRHQINLNEINK